MRSMLKVSLQANNMLLVVWVCVHQFLQKGQLFLSCLVPSSADDNMSTSYLCIYVRENLHGLIVTDQLDGNILVRLLILGLDN